jgi:hypothetical protein
MGALLKIGSASILRRDDRPRAQFGKLTPCVRVPFCVRHDPARELEEIQIEENRVPVTTRKQTLDQRTTFMIRTYTRCEELTPAQYPDRVCVYA